MNRIIAEDRAEDEACERLTPGCCIAHDREDDGDGECATW